MISLSHEDFQKSIVKDGGFEVYTQEQVNEKGLKEKKWIEIFKQNARDLNYVE